LTALYCCQNLCTSLLKAIKNTWWRTLAASRRSNSSVMELWNLAIFSFKSAIFTASCSISASAIHSNQPAKVIPQPSATN
jgi:hypothetical protein